MSITKRKRDVGQRGFTLLEITVVAIVITILATILLVNYKPGQKQFALIRSAHKLAQDLRNAQDMALVGERFNNFFPLGGYGIYLEGASPSTYILFADCNNNKTYDVNQTCPDCSVMPCVEDVFSETIKLINFEEGIEIKELYLEFLKPDSLSITFFPPDPAITIKSDTQATSTYGIIDLTSGEQTKSTKIYISGLIDID